MRFRTDKHSFNGHRTPGAGFRGLLTLALLGLLAALAVMVIKTPSGQGAESLSPWLDDEKPTASFLFTNPESLDRLQAALALSQEQRNALAAIGEQEAAALAMLKGESRPIVEDPDAGLTEKQLQLQEMDYNGQLRQRVLQSRTEVEALLEPSQAALLPAWTEEEMAGQKQEFIEAAAIASADAQAIGGQSYRVYATQYYSNFGADSIDVAVPDKYVKFASLGWEYHTGYPAGGDYTVNLSYNGRQLNGVRVKDVGPWNIDDNYWNGAAAPRPRRLFSGLSAGMPEAQAAYFDDYNNGLDQFGRVVSNPAGIDLSPRAGVELGLGYLVSGWVTVTFNWEGQASGYPVYGAIAARHAALGGAPGQPVCAEYDVAGGRAQNFTDGRLIWNRTTGQVSWVRGGILAAYDARGGPNGHLGLPQGDEEGVAGGRVSRFGGGHVYWSAATGARAVYGAILTKYLSLGGPGALGLPQGDEEGVAGGRVSRFGGGHVYWSAATGARAVYGAILTKYLSLGGPGALGLPQGDEEGVAGGRVSRFGGGHVYWSAATGARAVYGGILAKYLSLGSAAGQMGLPLTDEYDVTSGRRNDFRGGAIVWDLAFGQPRVILATGAPLR